MTSVIVVQTIAPLAFAGKVVAFVLLCQWLDKH